MDKHMTLDETPEAMLCSDCMQDGYNSEIKLYECSDCQRVGCEHCVEERSGDVATCVHRGGCIRAMCGEVMSASDAVDDDLVDAEDRV